MRVLELVRDWAASHPRTTTYLSVVSFVEAIVTVAIR